MKKIAFLVFLVGFSIKTFSQTQFIGLQGGVNFSNASSVLYFDGSKNKLGLTGGIGYELMLKNYIITTGLLYNQFGFIKRILFAYENGNIFEINSDFEYNYDYLSIPLKLGYSIGKKFRIVPMLGIQPSFLVKAGTIRPKLDINNQKIGFRTVNVKEYVSKFDLAGLLEIELNYSINSHIDIFTSCDYKYSFTTFSNDNYFSECKLKHYAYAFSVGMKYKISKD